MKNDDVDNQKTWDSKSITWFFYEFLNIIFIFNTNTLHKENHPLIEKIWDFESLLVQMHHNAD